MASNKLYVGNISYSVNSSQIKELFANHGEVKEVTIIAGKGFGFVEMGTPEEAEKAKTALNGTEWEGRTLKIDEARPMSDRKPRPSFQNRDRRGFQSGGRGRGRESRGYRRSSY